MTWVACCLILPHSQSRYLMKKTKLAWHSASPWALSLIGPNREGDSSAAFPERPFQSSEVHTWGLLTKVIQSRSQISSVWNKGKPWNAHGISQVAGHFGMVLMPYLNLYICESISKEYCSTLAFCALWIYRSTASFELKKNASTLIFV